MRALMAQALVTCATQMLSLALLPGVVSSQQHECAAEVSPDEIYAGQLSVRVTAVLPAPVRSHVELDTPPGSGLALAAPADIPRVDLAAEEEGPGPIELSADREGEVRIWVNTENARPGTHELTLINGERACTVEVTVPPG